MSDDGGGGYKVLYTQLVGDLDFESIKEPLKDIQRANASSDWESVELLVTSAGGNLYCAFALYDQIKASRKPVDVVAAGLCMSSAVVVLQAGRRRTARPHTVFALHPSSNSIERKPYSEFFSVADQYRRNHDLFVQLTIERAGIDRAAFEKMYEPIKYLSAEEAAEFGTHGLIDVVE